MEKIYSICYRKSNGKGEIKIMDRVVQKKKLKIVIFVFVAILIMAITNHNKVFRGNNQTIKNLYWNSEFLVYDTMIMSYQPGKEYPYGLGEMFAFNNASFEYALTDEERGFYKGYSTTEKVIAIRDCEETRYEYTVGNTMIFFNGDKADIVGVNAPGDGYLYVEYEADEIYSSKVQDNLKYISLYSNLAQTYMQIGQIVPYVSQVGLQGMIFREFPKEFTMVEIISIYRWGLAFLYATVMTLICYQIYKKYNVLFAIIFYMVTLLSPWLIGYSTNLYWVVFTWFLPMLAGLLCSNNINSRKMRMISYILVFVGVAIKCACGYEYISTIMLSSIVFLLSDLTLAIIDKRDKAEIWHLFKVIFIMGIFALLGFVVVMIIHSYLRGDGEIFSGLKAIFYTDVLRRTIGGDASTFQDIYSDSLNSNFIIVICRYLLFDTPVILGVPGFMFIPLIAVSFLGLVWGIRKGLLKKEILVLYIWMGIASVSWFILGKAHSYVHTMLNFVLWYFGFVQILFYAIIQIGKAYVLERKRKKANEE